MTKTKKIMLILSDGNFEQGFPHVIAQILGDDDRLKSQFTGSLPPAPSLINVYNDWQLTYLSWLDLCRKQRKIESVPISNSHGSIDSLSENLKDELNKWLDSDEFSDVKNKLLTNCNRSDEIWVIIQSDNLIIQGIPWHLWSFFDTYLGAEVALSTTCFEGEGYRSLS